MLLISDNLLYVNYRDTNNDIVYEIYYKRELLLTFSMLEYLADSSSTLH